jgi:hypothetical protein
MGVELRLYQDSLAAKARAQTALEPTSVRVLYVVQGALYVRAGDVVATLGANSAWHSAGAIDITGGSLPSLLLRWELVRPGTAANVLRGQGVDSRLALAAPVPLAGHQTHLLRCDRVDFPPNGVALTHTHRGPGIRCLLTGAIRIETKGAAHDYRPLEAWFEAGPDPVYAAASPDQPTAFARVMILPRELLGKSSIQYVRPEDLSKPKSQSYQILIDEPIELANECA